jgi:hypothetical protein
MQELAAELEKGKLVAVPFCSTGMEGKTCAEVVKEKTSGDVRGSRYAKREAAHGSCVACGKKASAVVYVARQY